MDYFQLKGVYCTLEWLMDGAGKTPYVLIDLNSNCDNQSDLTTIPFLISEEQKVKEEIALFHQHYQNSVGLQIEDDGMLPFYQLGSYAAGVPFYDSDILELIGLDCIIQTQEGKNFVRNLRKGRIDNTYTLVCINASTIVDQPILYDTKISFAAEVIFYRKVSIIK